MILLSTKATSRSGTKAWMDSTISRTVVKAAQTYTRLDEFTYHYASGTFEADLTVDEDGLVAGYADWRRTGFAFGPDDTAPLDSPT